MLWQPHAGGSLMLLGGSMLGGSPMLETRYLGVQVAELHGQTWAEEAVIPSSCSPELKGCTSQVPGSG